MWQAFWCFLDEHRLAVDPTQEVIRVLCPCGGFYHVQGTRHISLENKSTARKSTSIHVIDLPRKSTEGQQNHRNADTVNTTHLLLGSLQSYIACMQLHVSF